jgi:hypothetical protein
MLKEGLSIRVPHSPALSSVASLTTPRATRHFLHKLTDQYFFTHDLSPLQKGYVTAEAQCSQKKSIVWLRRVLRYASNHVSFLAFSAFSVSQRCVFAVKS